jgi:hypothetical protein
MGVAVGRFLCKKVSALFQSQSANYHKLLVMINSSCTNLILGWSEASTGAQCQGNRRKERHMDRRTTRSPVREKKAYSG